MSGDHHDDPQQDTSERGAGRRPIVSSAHLVSENAVELSEFEFGLIVVANAFSRWTVHCMAASGVADLSPLDVLVLHSVNHRDREKKASDICFILNIEDRHTVSYSLKKLLRMDLVVRRRKGKETSFATSKRGRSACRRYRDIREDCLVASLRSLGLDKAAVGSLADQLRALSGLYDQAARAATSL